MKHLKKFNDKLNEEKVDFIDECPSYSELVNAFKILKSAYKQIKKECYDIEYIQNYISDKVEKMFE